MLGVEFKELENRNLELEINFIDISQTIPLTCGLLLNLAMFDTSIHNALYIFPLLVMAGYMGVGNMGTRGAETPPVFC